MRPRRMLQALRSAVLVAAMCASIACTGEIHSPGGAPPAADATSLPDTPTTGPPTLSALTCDPEATPAPEPLKRMSSATYRNALGALLSDPVFAPVQDAADPLIADLPADGDTGQTFGTMDNRVAQAHTDVYFAVADRVGQDVAATSERRAALAGDCANEDPIADACLRDFITDFGARALRRPLAAGEVDRYAEIADLAPNGPTVLGDIVFSLLMAPQFLYVVENEGTPAAGNADVLELTPHEVAMRLSQLFWQSIPDAELMAAADDGSLLTEAGYDAQVERLANDPRTRPTVIAFFEEWFRIVETRGFPDNPLFHAIDDGVGADTDLYLDMRDEVRAMIDHLTWETEGSYRDLLTTDRIYTSSSRLAALYGVAPGGALLPGGQFPLGERSGVLTRSALLLQSGRTNPILRGARIRKEILCDDIHPPATLTSEDLAAPPLDPEMTTRERYDLKTSGANCVGCHTLLNPVGHTLEAYDGLGRFRTEERVYDDAGTVLATLPIDTSTVPRIDYGSEATVDDPVALMEGIADSAKTYDCFARHYFRFAFRRFEMNLEDGCTMTAVRDAVRDGSLVDALVSIAHQPAFKRRTLAPE